ncbi:hypothetical protein Tco_0005094 [Tanacetum coccineum]
MDIEENVEVENVERPVDLYKAICSDDLGDEEESNNNTNQPNDPTMKIQVANTALTRIVAGDFLESLVKDLGLEVPFNQPYAEKHCGCWSGYSYCKYANSNWFAFQDNIKDNAPHSATSASAMLDEVNLKRTFHGGNSSSDNEVVVG